MEKIAKFSLGHLNLAIVHRRGRIALHALSYRLFIAHLVPLDVKLKNSKKSGWVLVSRHLQ